MRVYIYWMIGLAVLWQSCGSVGLQEESSDAGATEMLCTPGRVFVCPCGGSAADGTQQCAEDGMSFEECQCDTGATDGDTDSDTDTDTDSDTDSDMDSDSDSDMDSDSDSDMDSDTDSDSSSQGETDDHDESPYLFEAELTSVMMGEDGVMYLFDQTADLVHRFDVDTNTMLSPLKGTTGFDAVAFTISPDGAETFLAYDGGRIERFDNATGDRELFGAAAGTVSTLIVARDLLFSIDSSGSWDTQCLWDLATGEVLDSDDWRDTARDILFAQSLDRLIMLNSGVSPADINYIDIDFATGTLGEEIDSPYHGDYAIPAPIRLTPDETAVVVGSGLYFSTADLTYQTSMGLTHVDLAFHGDQMILIDTVDEETLLRIVDEEFNILSESLYPGEAAAFRIFEEQGILVTRFDGNRLSILNVSL